MCTQKINSLLFFVLLALPVLSKDPTNFAVGGYPTSSTSDTNAPVQSNPKRDYAINLINEIELNSAFISKLSSADATLTLPKGISRKIGPVRYSIAIDSMKFRSDGAYLSAYAGVEFPGANGSKHERTIAFGAKNVKFNPEGVLGGQQARLYLLSDHIITIDSNVTLVLKGDENANWVSWNCGGFERVHLKGKFVFNNNKFKPAPGLTNETDVTAAFETEFASMQDFIAQVSITPFTIKGLNDVKFEVINATVDYSQLSNASNMVFPLGYQNPNLDDDPANENGTPTANNSALWTGFYLGSLTVHLPPELNKNNARTTISVSNMLIDNTGFTGRVAANNVFSTTEGSMSGWGFSLDQIGLNFLCNNLVGGDLAGKVMLPVDEVKSLNYSASVSKLPESNNLNYLFAISPTDAINFAVLGASVNINNNSSIQVAVVNNKFKPSAILNGHIVFNTRYI
jgi:hypothetical protein